MSVHKMKIRMVLFLGICFLTAILYPGVGSSDSVQWAKEMISKKVAHFSKVEPYGEKGMKLTFSPTDWLIFTNEEIRNGNFEWGVEFYQLRHRPWDGQVWLSFDSTNRQLIAETAIKAWQLRYNNYQLLSKDPQQAASLLVHDVTNYYQNEKHRKKKIVHALIDEGLALGIIKMKSGS